HGAGLSADPRHRRRFRPACHLLGAGEMGGSLAGIENRPQPAAAEDAHERRPWRRFRAPGSAGGDCPHTGTPASGTGAPLARDERMINALTNRWRFLTVSIIKWQESAKGCPEDASTARRHESSALAEFGALRSICL